MINKPLRAACLLSIGFIIDDTTVLDTLNLVAKGYRADIHNAKN